MATLTVFEHPNYNMTEPGHTVVFYKDVNDLRAYTMIDRPWPLPDTSWNDQISSLKIQDGSVVFYTDINYGGAHSDVLKPGSYDVKDLLAHHIAPDSISSFDFL